MLTATLNSCDLTERQFNTISDLVKDLCGINLHEGKKELVKARLTKRIHQLGMESFGQYIEFIGTAEGGAEILAMLDALSTNLTFFFRETAHFDLLRGQVAPEMIRRHAQDRKLRLWSAGCSSGEEPYSLAIVMNEVLKGAPAWNCQILATDLSGRMLDLARRGIYSRERFRETPAQIIAREFTPLRGQESKQYQVNDAARRMVTFARLNLMESWPMRGPFDVIFCRNVMIYFDKPTQNRLVNRFWELLVPGGMLFIGHSESLSGAQHRFQYVQPTVYRKE